MAHFPNNFGFTGTLRPLRLQGDILDMEVEGEIPAELDGAFHRVHPDNQFSPVSEDDQFFNGDGMVSMFRVKNGKVDFRQRYAHTDKWKLENAAGRSLFGEYRNHLTDDPSVEGRIRGTANTNVMVHAGRLYAMKEDSPCLLMDPNTLETQGYTDFGGRLEAQTFCAHPKIDPKTGNMCAFSYMSKGPLTHDMSYFEISPAGEVLFEIPFENKYLCMMHDFGITEDYAVWNVMPLITNLDRLEKRMPYFGWDATLPTWMAVLPRKAGATAKDIRWFRAPASQAFTGHVMNAFNEGTKVHFDLPVSAKNNFPFFPDVDGSPFDPVGGLQYLTRWTVDMSTNGEEFQQVERLTTMADEFPRIDDRYAGQAYRHGWMLAFDTGKTYEGPPGPFASALNTLCHLDLSTGATRSWWPGPRSGIQEPCFIPKGPDAAEGEGYVVALVDDHISNYTDLCFFDAQRVDEGPIARAKLPVKLRQGLHGNWSTAAQLSSAA